MIAWVCAPCFVAYALACAYLAAKSGPKGIAGLNRSIGFLGILPLVTPALVAGSGWERLQSRRRGRSLAHGGTSATGSGAGPASDR